MTGPAPIVHRTDLPSVPALEYLHAMEPDSDLFSIGALGSPEAKVMREKLHLLLDDDLDREIKKLRKDYPDATIP